GRSDLGCGLAGHDGSSVVYGGRTGAGALPGGLPSRDRGVPTLSAPVLRLCPRPGLKEPTMTRSPTLCPGCAGQRQSPYPRMPCRAAATASSCLLGARPLCCLARLHARTDVTYTV